MNEQELLMDYKVLCEVRDTWDISDQWPWQDALRDIWADRWRAAGQPRPIAPMWISYLPGDFAKAVERARSEQEEVEVKPYNAPGHHLPDCGCDMCVQDRP